MSETETYIIKNTKTNLYFVKFVKEPTNKPAWSDKDKAAEFEEMGALRMQRRLQNMYEPSQKILIEEKV